MHMAANPCTNAKATATNARDQRNGSLRQSVSCAEPQVAAMYNNKYKNTSIYI